MNQIWMAAFTYASALILLTEAFSLMYRLTKVPNYALGTLMTIGSYTTYTSKHILHNPLYLGFPAAFLVGSILALIISTFIIEPLMRKGRSLVEMTLATIGLGILLEALIQIYHKYIKVPHTNIMLRQYDFKIGEIYSVFPASAILAISSFLLIRHIFKSTRFGCSVRAVLDNVELAQVQGINPTRSRKGIWVLAGGLAGLSGAIMTMWFHLTPISGSWIMISIIAAALLGGIDSYKGAFIGGFLTGLGEIMLVTWGQSIIGVWVGEFRIVLPVMVIVLVLMFAPNGLFGSDIVQDGLVSRYRLTKANRKYLMIASILLIVCGSLFTHTCNVNKAKVRDEVIQGFSGYDLEVREMDRSVTRFNVGNLTVFKNTVERLNISRVYMEPKGVTFYYIRNDVYWVTNVRFKRVGLCRFEVE